MNDGQPITTTNPQLRWSKKKISLLILVFVMLAGTLFFHIAAGKVRLAAEQSLLAKANETVNGQIVVSSIDLSILGYVEAKDVQVLDAAAKPLARISRVHISYNWSDLLKGQLGPQLIKGVTLDRPEIWVAYHQDHLNWDGLLKPTTSDQPAFSGVVKIRDGKINLETDILEKSVEQLNGELNCHQENQIGISATGKLDQAALTMAGHWGTQASKITLSAKEMDLAKLGLTTADDPIQLTGGSLDEVTVTIGKDDTSGLMLLQALSGRFSNVTTTGALVLNQGNAQFEKQGDDIQFTDGQAVYQGQTITADGKVLTAPSGEKTLDLNFQLPSGDPAALLPNLQAGGALTAQGKIIGSVFSPVISGNYTLDSLQFGSMIISGINGTFSYTDHLLQLLSANGATIGGSVTASGEINPDTQQYSLSVSGSGLDTSQLTTKDVKGPLSFAGTASGSASEAVVQGSFTIYNGNAYGITFQTLTGDFIKRGSGEAEVSNLAIETDFGVFYPEQLNQSVMEELRARKLPTTRAEIKEKVTEKILEKLFH